MVTTERVIYRHRCDDPLSPRSEYGYKSATIMDG
jgi:hypothetical protein